MPLGAGKSTLLNVLAGRIEIGQIRGSIQVNDKPRNKKTWKKQMGYVMQEDLMFKSLTVRETLQYTALLRLPSKQLTRAEKIESAEAVIQELQLQRCADSRIGGEGM